MAVLPLTFVPSQHLGASSWLSTNSSWKPGRAPVCNLTTRRPLWPHRNVRPVLAPVMLLDSLSDRLSETVRKIRGVDRITENNVSGALKEVKRALLDGDVNLRVVNSLLKEIRKRAIGAEVVPGVEPGQMLIKIMHEELTNIMGKDQAPLAKRVDGAPTVVLLAGLQGSGKTTAAAKLALYCLNQKRPVLLVAADVYRPAAIAQLQTLGSSIDVEVFERGTDTNPRDIVRAGVEHAKRKKINTVIVDTAGRQVVEENLMRELKDIKRICKADETLLVVDAMTGQEAATLARAFNEAVGITGAVLTKMDGDTRGGAALSVQQVSNAPIKFIGVGEKVEKLEPFYPDRMASRILGMGDVVTLVEKAQEAMDEKEAEKMTKKMMEAKFDYDDFLKQTRMLARVGSMAGFIKMIPGAAGQMSPEKLSQAETKLKIADSLIKSMTKEERATPELFSSSPTARNRILRIARGSGRSEKQARELVSDFGKMRSMMQKMSRKMMGQEEAAPDASMGNRSSRRRAAKKKTQQSVTKRGFG